MAAYETKEAPGCCLPCQGVETRDWYAWLNLMPPPPDELHVVGEVYVPNPGVDPFLAYRAPQGINPRSSSSTSTSASGPRDPEPDKSGRAQRRAT